MALRVTVPPLAKPVEAVRVNFSLPIRPLPWAATCELRRGIREFRVSHRIFFVEERFGASVSPRGAATRPIGRARLAALEN